jgi:dihydrofolate synthase/folylpolyglutamate synthase
MTYAEALARLLALRGGEHAGLRPGLERVEGLLAALGHPEQRYTLVQIGGTNGKGSIAAMLAAILKAEGRRVGLYTSPHLVSFRERIRVNGGAISEDGIVDGVEALGTLITRFDTSVFEATTALALDHFARESVDIAVLEVGLGGRLDATTVGAPAATVLSRIDLDHQAWLGPTLAAIAVEKAAIIRTGVALSAAQHPEVLSVVQARAATTGVPLRLEGRDLHVTVLERDLGGQRISCRGPDWSLDSARLALLGSYQPSNALLAVATARDLGSQEAAIRTGLERARWPGRLQIVPGRPTLVLDAAHNPAGARALAEALPEAIGDAPVVACLALLADKDVAGVLGALAPRLELAICTELPHGLLRHAGRPGSRSLEASRLAEIAAASGLETETLEAPEEALRRTLVLARERDAVALVSGSHYLLHYAWTERHAQSSFR